MGKNLIIGVLVMLVCDGFYFANKERRVVDRYAESERRCLNDAANTTELLSQCGERSNQLNDGIDICINQLDTCEDELQACRKHDLGVAK